MFSLDFLRKIEYVRVLSFLGIGVIVAVELLSPGTTSKVMEALTGALALAGLIKSKYPYDKPQLPPLDSASNPLDQ